ncbi:hypothetical protein U9M48_020998 [Paspalum notatum var. saurae]|uniref:Uncharacterized protein n=1 Tax=Paspalum notatum var. saurae TaxID=547442 RepID=A0AAQ3WTD6_PASNO
MRMPARDSDSDGPARRELEKSLAASKKGATATTSSASSHPKPPPLTTAPSILFSRISSSSISPREPVHALKTPPLFRSQRKGKDSEGWGAR